MKPYRPDAHVTPQGDILLDAGRSPKGWSRIGSAFRCMELYRQERDADRMGINTGGDVEVLVKGSLGHVGMAHIHEAWRLLQQGIDPAAYRLLPWDAAMLAYGARHGVQPGWTSAMLDCVRNWLSQHPEPPGRILAVEELVYGVLGWKPAAQAGQPQAWGIHAVKPIPGGEEPLQLPGGNMVAQDGQEVAPARLDCPGHPQHGEPLWRTRRLDSIYQDAMGVICVEDHKFKSYVSRWIGREYRLDGQFSLARHIAIGYWPQHRLKATIHGIQRADPYTTVRADLERPVWDDAFPFILWRKLHEIARAEMDEAQAQAAGQPYYWEPAMNEQVCKGRYGYCRGADCCMGVE